MLKLSTKRILGIISCLTLVLLVMNPVVFTQEKTKDLEKKYAAIVGTYEFDLTDQGLGATTVEFYVENDALWAWPETASGPAELEPVEGKVFEFFVEDPDEGLYEVKFMKDESGKYTKCHVKNDTAGMDVIGVKVEE